jgi:hypothetical protein
MLKYSEEEDTIDYVLFITRKGTGKLHYNKNKRTSTKGIIYRAGKEFTLSKWCTNLFSHSVPSGGRKSSLETHA